MKLPIYQIDAFTDHVFGGNPAAVIPLEKWLSNELLQKIANENNLSETVYFVKEEENYRIRWFTPVNEVKLCGHATLATAYLLFEYLGYDKKQILFDSLSGILRVEKEGSLISLDFPVANYQTMNATNLANELNLNIIDAFKAEDIVLVLTSEEEVQNYIPDFNIISKIETRGLIISARGNEVDFVSRFFAPRHGINEDPVTGSAHTLLTPYWSAKLNKKTLTAAQLSNREGQLIVEDLGKRIKISGQAAFYMKGEIEIQF